MQPFATETTTQEEQVEKASVRGVSSDQWKLRWAYQLADPVALVRQPKSRPGIYFYQLISHLLLQHPLHDTLPSSYTASNTSLSIRLSSPPGYCRQLLFYEKPVEAGLIALCQAIQCAGAVMYICSSPI